MRFYEVYRPELLIADGKGGKPHHVPAFRKFETKKSRAKATARVLNGDENSSAANPITVREHRVKGKAALLDFMNALMHGTRPIRASRELHVGKLRRTDGRKWHKGGKARRK